MNAATSNIAAIPMWGTTWVCTVDADGRVQQVKIGGHWHPARATLRDTICDALERTYAEMPA